jgi:hypothetical protein
MKKIILVAFMGVVIFSNAQEKQKLEDIFSVEAGLIGVWINYEKVLSNNFTLDTEFGYTGGVLRGTNNRSIDYIFTTIFSFEPRYYYNFNKRLLEERSITNNSANYFTVQFYYVPNWLTESNRQGAGVESNFGIIPKWGFRRNLVQNLNFDFAIGIGYSSAKYREKHIQTALDIRLSYSF